MRFYDPQAGSVTIDGIDVRQVTQASLRARLGVVFQESFLFNLSIRENLRLGRADATDAEIEAAARSFIHVFRGGGDIRPLFPRLVSPTCRRPGRGACEPSSAPMTTRPWTWRS